MDHIDEHTLELHVLGAAEVEGRRGEIERHLGVCHGCRELVARIRTYYSAVDRELKTAPTDPAVIDRAIVRAGGGLERWYEQFDVAMFQRPRGPLQRIRNFTRVHPVATAGSSLALVAALALLINLVTSGVGERENPTTVVFNGAKGSVSILGKTGRVLWEKFSSLTTSGAGVLGINRPRFSFLDLNGDGINEVLTTMPFDADETERSGDLFIYDSRGVVVSRVSFTRPVAYLDRHYPRQFFGGPVIAGDITGSGESEIFVEASNVRSPSFIARLDLQRNENATLWHFGHLGYVRVLDVDGDGKKELMAGGVNDSRDTLRGEFPVVVVLDPARIKGVTRSTASPGFHLPPSDAELFYLALPFADVDSILGRQPNVYEITDGKDATFDVTVRTATGLDESFTLDYIFNSRMEIIEVKSNNTSDRLHDQLRAMGKARRRLDAAYLEALRRSVRYWDGQTWQSTTTAVKHTPAVSQMIPRQ